MQFTYSPYILPLAAAALVSGWVMAYVWQRRSAPNAMALALMAFGITEWTLGYILEIAGADLPTKLFWGKIQYIGITFTPLAWFLFSYFQTNQGRRPNHRYLLALAAIPITTILLVFTTEYHGLVWGTIDIYRTENFSVLDVSHGVWFWVHSAYSYLLLLAGTIIILRGLGRMQGLYRGQAAALFIAVVAPWAGNVIYLSGLSPIPNLDLTPFAFTISLAGVAWGIFGYQLVNISPIARDLIVDNMTDGMIALDLRGRIADMNPAAARMIGVPVSQALGKLPAEVLVPWPHLIERFRGVTEATDEIVVGEGEAQRRYDVHISPLYDQGQRDLGRIITIRDIRAGQIPQPRFAVREPETTRPQIEMDAPPTGETRRAIPVLGWLVDFFTTPTKTDLPVPPDVNPKWHQARERSFTLILRIVALLGTIALVSVPILGELITALPFAIILAIIWVLGLARNVNFNIRVSVFLLLVYALACIETYSYGYSAESFTFFISLVAVGTLMLGRNGGLITFAVAVITISIFGYIFGSGLSVPVNAIVTAGSPPPPGTVQHALTSALAFSANAAAIVVSINILMESLNKAWRLETQALNLLQQERDLLEQRVTERTRDLAEARDEAIKTSNELRKYFMAIEQSGNSIVITDTRGEIEYVNPRFTELTGYSFDEAIGQNLRILKSGEHSQEFYKNLWDTIKAGQIWRGEIYNQKKDGSLFWESDTIAPVFNHLGEITNFVAIKEDISQIKQTQEALSLARDQALESNRLKTQFLAKVSHELRTPLGSIMGYAELLRDEFYGPLDDEKKDPVASIVANVNFLADMVNDLLDEAQLETKNMSLRMGMFSPAALLEKTAAHLAVLAGNKGLAFSTELIPPIPERLYGDEQRLQQILVNLASNAIKFTKAGEVRIRIYQNDPVYWGIKVIDTGAGIPAEAQQFIFEPFRQVDNTITRENRGSGLGLTIVKQLVELMDGVISLESAVGEGSAFTILLPTIHRQESSL
jgi:PAS domain S-box-containing protein